MWAAAEGHDDVIRALVGKGADLAARSKNGFTPLLFAAREGHRRAVATLLDLGSRLDESLAVSSAETAGGVAREQRQANLDAFLLAASNAHFELAAYLWTGAPTLMRRRVDGPRFTLRLGSGKWAKPAATIRRRWVPAT